MRAAIQPTNNVETSNENTRNSRLFPVFHAANPTTRMIIIKTPPPLVGSNGKSRFATSSLAERASGGTMKIVSSSAIKSETIAAAPASPFWFSRRANTVTSAAPRPASTSSVPRTTRNNEVLSGSRWESLTKVSEGDADGLQDFVEYGFCFFAAPQRRRETRTHDDA